MIQSTAMLYGARTALNTDFSCNSESLSITPMKVLAGVLAGEIGERQLLGRLHELFTAAGEQIYLVGGSVRDMLIEPAAHDFDLDMATSAAPDRTEKLLRKAK